MMLKLFFLSVFINIELHFFSVKRKQMRITHFNLFIFFHKHGHEYLKKKHNYFFNLSKIIKLKL